MLVNHAGLSKKSSGPLPRACAQIGQEVRLIHEAAQTLRKRGGITGWEGQSGLARDFRGASVVCDNHRAPRGHLLHYDETCRLFIERRNYNSRGVLQSGAERFPLKKSSELDGGRSGVRFVGDGFEGGALGAVTDDLEYEAPAFALEQARGLEQRHHALFVDEAAHIRD